MHNFTIFFFRMIGFCASDLEKMQFDATVKESVDS